MEIRNLITFRHICQLQSFTKAAAALGYTQSAVTMQIKQLEEELQVQLFDRIGKTIRITNEGQRLIKYADEILRSAENARNDLMSEPDPKGILRIGILESVCTATLPSILRAYHMRYPEVATVIHTGTLDELTPMLNANQIDLLWVFDQELIFPEWTCAYVYRDSIEIICSSSHEFSSLGKKTLSGLSSESFILTEKSCSYRNIFEERMVAKGHALDIFLEIGNTEMIKKFVEADLGITVLPRFTVEEEVFSGKLMLLPVEDFHLEMKGQIFYHRDKWLSPAIRLFIRQIEESFTNTST